VTIGDARNAAVSDSNAEWTVDQQDARLRLDKFLADPARLGSRSRAANALERGKVFLNGVESGMTQAAYRLQPGDHIRVWVDRPGSSRPPRTTTGDLAIVYEDTALIVCNKPPGLLTVPLERQPAASSVRDQLRDYLRPYRRHPFVVHRIDRDTSGLVLFAKSEAAQAALKGQFRRREPERVYWAIVYGHPEPRTGVWRDHLFWDDRALIQKETRPGDPRASEAECHYQVVEGFPDTSLIEVSLVSGKRNQIRLQARLRGHTLVGEQRYVFGPAELRPLSFPRQALHARRLAFAHPDDGRPLVFEADLPADMADLLARLREAAR
jgi:23S rRNA pseudouridine1911/1915/1917 synthase